jgi:hypothetical protein
VTDKGVAKLKAALPKCNIVADVKAPASVKALTPMHKNALGVYEVTQEEWPARNPTARSSSTSTSRRNSCRRIEQT